MSWCHYPRAERAGTTGARAQAGTVNPVSGPLASFSPAPAATVHHRPRTRRVASGDAPLSPMALDGPHFTVEELFRGFELETT